MACQQQQSGKAGDVVVLYSTGSRWQILVEGAVFGNVKGWIQRWGRGPGSVKVEQVWVGYMRDGVGQYSRELQSRRRGITLSCMPVLGAPCLASLHTERRGLLRFARHPSLGQGVDRPRELYQLCDETC